MTTVIVDGYNAIHAWPELKAAMLGASLAEARRLLVASLAEYAAVRRVEVIVVFDSQGRGPGPAAVEVVDGVTVRYSGGAVSADTVIERLVYGARRRGTAQEVVVATSDRLQRDMVRSMGAVTIDAPTLEGEVREAVAEVGRATGRMRQEVQFSRRLENRLPASVRDRLEAMRRGQGAGPGGGVTPG